MNVLEITGLRPFLPSKDFEVSKAFYTALGFSLKWEGDGMAIFQAGTFQFFLQDYYHEGWAKNCMVNLVVANVDAWAKKIQADGIMDRFEGVKVCDPQEGEHGIILYLNDPTGVLWHIQQLSGPGQPE